MASNPMQRKVRNSFLLGILVMLLIAILIGALVFFLVIKPKMDEEKSEEQQLYANVYRLKTGVNIESGQDITSSMVESVMIPVVTETTDFVPSKKKNSEGKLVDTAFPGGYKSKIDLTGGTIVTYNMLYTEELSDSLRYVEYNMISIPTTLDIEMYVDIRLRLPNSQDLIVVAKKEIQNVYGQTVGLNLTEDEILLLNSAIVEAYIMPGSELYLASYVEPGMQDKAQYTYSPTAEVVALIKANENIVQEARETIAGRYEASGDIRIPILNQLNKYTEEEKKNNIETGMQEQIEAARKAREEYLGELEGY